MPSPLISVLTPVLNAAATLGQALDSAQQPAPVPVEILVQDGGSTDGSTALWQARPAVHGRVEPDGGLYEAMNRLLHRARSPWVVFLQADDWLEPGAFAAWWRGVEKNPAAEVITGGARAVQWSPSTQTWETVWTREQAEDKAWSPSVLILGEPMLNARLYRRERLLALGGFHPRWRLASDRDLLLRLHATGCAAASIPETVYRYRWHAASLTMNSGHAAAQRLTLENLEIAEVHLREQHPKTVHHCLRAWHQRESVRLAMNALEMRDGRSFSLACWRGTRHHPAWVGAFLAEFTRSFLGWVARGGRTRSQLAQTHPAPPPPKIP